MDLNLFSCLPVRVCVCVCVQSLSHVQLFVTPWTGQASLPMEFPRQEYWDGLAFPAPWAPPDPGATCVSCVCCTGRWDLDHSVTWGALFSSGCIQMVSDFLFTILLRKYHLASAFVSARKIHISMVMTARDMCILQFIRKFHMT